MTGKSYSTKSFILSKYTFWVQSQHSTTFLAKYIKIPNQYPINPIISIIAKSKCLIENTFSTKSFFSSKYTFQALSWLSTTFRSEVNILAQLPNAANQLTQLYQLSWKLKVWYESCPLQSCSFYQSTHFGSNPSILRPS